MPDHQLPEVSLANEEWDFSGCPEDEIVELLITDGAAINAKNDDGDTPLDIADNMEILQLIRKHGGKTGEELKAEGK